ncbi:multidrug efflux RND transporter permease subunit [Hanamia caeni]|uniref:Multidrug efflux RND transporter permease subunit n=1 Tax=Hanamia caeni TaxID=2294116 RepID=A0A3M9NNV0_9BACT|nr:multidrug efflux RND transporter permease subunit [Hanamia caeni]RNI39175.1 multidrug efflux RND transporter permease subunit [Hanamia caeni]
MIAETFIKRPVTAIVISIVIVLVGIISITNLPIAQYPDISPPTVSISGNFIGADAKTVEETVTTPLETQINGSPGMSYITSNSTSSGSSSITATFDVGTDVDIAALDVQNRVNVALPTLPDAVRRLGVRVLKRNPSFIEVLAFYSPNGTHDSKFIGNYVNIYMVDALKRVPGVGDITAFGSDFGMRVWLDPEKLAALKLTPADITAAINEQNLEIAPGTVGGVPQPGIQSFEYSILTNSRINTPEQFKNIIIRSDPATGNIVYLKDVARVELGKFTYANNALVDGKPATFLLIFQAPGANALETFNGINKELEKLRKTFPSDIDFSVPSESVSVVKTSMKEVITTLLEALTLVVIVVFLFLQNWRATLIPVLAIPVSLIGTFIFFVPFGFTINTLTLFAFILAIGIVVDDAIIVVEAVQHNIDHNNLSPRDATKKAMKEISAPVIAIALILASVFVPVGFIPGIVGRLYQQFAITIAVSVIISAFVALSLTPALCTLMLKHSKDEKAKKGLLGKFFFSFNNWFRKTTNSYSRGVALWIRRWPYIIVLLVVIFVGLFFLFKAKPTGFIPQEDEGRLYLTYEMPEGASTNRSIEMLTQIQQRLKAIPEINEAGGLAGYNIISSSNKSNVGTMFIHLKPWDERKGSEHSQQAVMQKIYQKTADIKGAKILVIAPPAVPGLGRTAGFTFELQQTTSTDDIQQFSKVTQDFLGQLNKMPQIGGAYTFFTANTPSYQVNVDREKAKQLGVSVADVYNTMSTLLGSAYINDFNLYGRNFRVVSQADSSYRSSLSEIGKYYVRNNQGNMIPLSSLITTQLIESATAISHYNIYRSIEINGTPAPGYSSGQAIDALKEAAAKYLPTGYGYEFSGMSSEEIKSGNKAGMIFAISIVFVFLFLAALYESWSVPFSVLLAVPIGALGSIIALTFLPGLTNNIYAQIGLITLIGLAAKNAILIVEFAKDRVDAGMDLMKATISAVKLRLRPILMTSFAFILGVLPLAFASGAAAESRKTIGWTVFGGMLAATSLAIFIVPVLYVVITKAAYGKKKLAELKAGYKPEEHEEFEEDID